MEQIQCIQEEEIIRINEPARKLINEHTLKFIKERFDISDIPSIVEAVEKYPVTAWRVREYYRAKATDPDFTFVWKTYTYEYFEYVLACICSGSVVVAPLLRCELIECLLEFKF